MAVSMEIARRAAVSVGNGVRGQWQAELALTLDGVAVVLVHEQLCASTARRRARGAGEPVLVIRISQQRLQKLMANTKRISLIPTSLRVVVMHEVSAILYREVASLGDIWW
jgi:hypothetical protein